MFLIFVVLLLAVAVAVSAVAVVLDQLWLLLSPAAYRRRMRELELLARMP